MPTPILTSTVHAGLLACAKAGGGPVECSLDLGLSTTTVDAQPEIWHWQGQEYPYLQACKDRTIYYWDGESFQPASRFNGSLIKLVPTEWGSPTFEIDGIKMLPTARVSPFADAQSKVALIQPQGKVILDTCGGLGYFAAWCLRGQAARVQSYEKNPDVIWLRSLNPWSPQSGAEGLTLSVRDITEEITRLGTASVDVVLHDPPRFGIAGELYSKTFYSQLSRVLRHRGKMFHYTGSPNKLTSGRDVPNEVLKRLREVGFKAEIKGDGVLATRQSITWTGG